jgi:hypothetical protein
VQFHCEVTLRGATFDNGGLVRHSNIAIMASWLSRREERKQRYSS